MSAPVDPIRRLAEERGHLMGELGARPEDGRWARAEADVIASLTTPAFRIRVPAVFRRFLRRLGRAVA